MRTISFEVTGQHIECTEAISDLVGNTREYVQAKFSLPTEWDGLIQIAVFTANGKNYPVLIEDGKCEVPYKVMMQEYFTVGCYAGAKTDRITTDTCVVRVEESVRCQGGSDYLSIYQKMQDTLNEMVAKVNEYEAAVENYKDKFESVKIAEPLLGEVGADETAINEDKAAVAEAITAEAVKTAGFDSLDAAKEEGTAFVFMGHGTSHTAKISYSQMQTQMEQLGYENVFIGTVEGEPEDTACEAVIEKLKNAGYKKVILRPLMVVAGDHANNDMAGDEDDSWKSQVEASGVSDSIDTQIAGLGEIDAIQQLYVAHTQAAIDAE